jgi:hypothetical protein
MVPTEIAGCKGVLVPEQFLRNALACRKVEVPKVQAKLDKCLRDYDIMKKSWENKEYVYQDAVRSARKEGDLINKIVIISLSVVSGALIGVMF